MYVVLGANASPFVRKVRAFLLEKGLPYSLTPVSPFAPPPDWRKTSPLGKIPAFRDGDFTLADSSVICAYIERKHPSPALYPSDPKDYARALWFEEWADAGLAAVVGPKIFFPRVIGKLLMKREPDEAAVAKAIDNDLPPLLDYLEGELAGREFLVGAGPTIGDLGVATQFVNLRHAAVTVDAGRWPKLAAYIGRMHGRPSFGPLIEEEAKFFAGARG